MVSGIVLGDAMCKCHYLRDLDGIIFTLQSEEIEINRNN